MTAPRARLGHAWRIGPDGAATALLALAIGAWIAPAVAGLAAGLWQTEAGTLGPLVILCGTATLLHDLRRPGTGRFMPGRPATTAAMLGAAAMLHAFAWATGILPLLCVAVWGGVVAMLHGLVGWAGLRRARMALAFLLLAVPLPYSLSVGANAWLRDHLALHAAQFCHWLGLETAVDGNSVYVGPYELAVETACAGLSSTVSLIMVGLLYAHWSGRGKPARMALIVALAIPVALAANLLRVIVLVMLVDRLGAGVLSTWIHPVSGFLSFGLALAILAGADTLSQKAGWLRR